MRENKRYIVEFDVKRSHKTYCIFCCVYATNKKQAIEQVKQLWYEKHKAHMFRITCEPTITDNFSNNYFHSYECVTEYID